MFGVQSDSPDPPRIRGPQSGRPSPEWTGWLVEGRGGRGRVLACPIMPWITPSSPRQLLNSYPPFCGAKPNCVERDGRGAHWNPLAWGVFSPLRPECWHWHNFTQIYTHSHKMPAKGFERAIEGKGRDALKDTTHVFIFLILSASIFFLFVFRCFCGFKCRI